VTGPGPGNATEGGHKSARERRKGKMKTNVYKTFRGYEIEIISGRTKLFVRNVYKGVANCYLDHSGAKAYKSKARAEEVAQKIKSGELKIK